MPSRRASTTPPSPAAPRRRRRASPPRAWLLLALAPLALVGAVARDALGVWRGPPQGRVDCVGGVALVMGAAQYDGHPSPALRRRLDEALARYREGCAERIVVSGGRRPGDRFSEGSAGVRYLTDRGVPPADVTAEERARSTAQNLVYSRPLLGDGPVVVITDDLHAYRCWWMARRLGIDAQVLGVPVVQGRARYAVREVEALLAYRLGVVR